MFNFVKKPFQCPKKEQWLCFFRVLDKKEKYYFIFFLTLFVISSYFLISNFYFNNTKIVPAVGGIYREALIGQPRFINPIYATSDVDRDIVQLVYSGLMKYNNKGEIIFDLVESYEIKEDETVYLISLKQDIFWHDGNPLTADDVLFTVQTIQNPEYKSPFRANWMGVNVEKINDFEIKFTLNKPYIGFLENLTLKILPKHIWSEISPENAPLSSYNFKPIGSGQYQVKELNQEEDRISSLFLERVKDSYIAQIQFYFFDQIEEIQKVDGFGSVKIENNNWVVYNILMPRYFALFFKLETEIFQDKEIRKSLSYGVDKEKFSGIAINSPFFPEFYNIDSFDNYQFNFEKAEQILEQKGFIKNEETGYREKIIKEESGFSFSQDLKTGSRGAEVTELQKCLSRFEDIYPEGEVTGYFGAKTKEAVINFQEKYKEDILSPWGFTEGTGLVSETTREKLNEVCFSTEAEIISLRFSISTLNQPGLLESANVLKEQMKKLGIYVSIETITEQGIKEREYESLLIGIMLGAILDPLPFWHSDQTKDPGYNFSLYQNKDLDKLLQTARETLDIALYNETIQQIQEIIMADFPAIFLYTQGYTYNISSKIKGVEFEKIVNPSNRFSQIENWYINTKRLWK